MADIDIAANVERYMGSRSPEGRYSSFDFCFNYFQRFSTTGRLEDLIVPGQLETSCLQLGFYLASWGMLRGSTDLLQRSVRVFAPLLHQLVEAPELLWRLDADAYDRTSIGEIQGMASVIRSTLPGTVSDILVTKIMLGTMGCVPAFDTYFRRGFGVSTFGDRSLEKVGEFCRANIEAIDAVRPDTIDFTTGELTSVRYPRAKVIDMVFFVQGMR